MRVWHWLIIIVVLAFFGTIAWWWRHSSSSASKDDKLHLKPKVSMASINITDIDPDGIKATSRLVLNNPLPIEIKTNRLDYEIFIDSIRVIKSSYSKPIQIRSADSTTIDMPIEILAKPLQAVFKHFKNAKIDSADYILKSTFQVDVPVAGERTFNMDLKKRLPAVKMPTMKPGKINIENLGLHKSEMEMVMLVENPNIFPLKIKDATYTVLIDKKFKMDGVMKKIINIPANGSEPIPMHLDIKTAKISKLAWKILFEKKDTDFSIEFNCKMVTENEMLKNSKMAFTAHGTLDELNEASGQTK